MQQLESEELGSSSGPVQCFRKQNFTSLSLGFSIYKLDVS